MPPVGGKTITEVSKILFKAYNTIKNWWQALRNARTGNKKNTRPSAKDQKQDTFVKAKIKEERHVVPEKIARDLWRTTACPGCAAQCTA